MCAVIWLGATVLKGQYKALLPHFPMALAAFQRPCTSAGTTGYHRLDNEA